MAAETYTKKQIVDALAGIVDIHEREIGYWTDLEIVVPSVANPKGRGYTRYYSFSNVVDFAIAKRMADAGLSLKAIRMAMEKFREGHRIRYFTHIIRRQIVVVQNPNSELVHVDVRSQAHANGPEIKLDMSKAAAYFILDMTDTIEKLRRIKHD